VFGKGVACAAPRQAFEDVALLSKSLKLKVLADGVPNQQCGGHGQSLLKDHFLCCQGGLVAFPLLSLSMPFSDSNYKHAAATHLLTSGATKFRYFFKRVVPSYLYLADVKGFGYLLFTFTPFWTQFRTSFGSFRKQYVCALFLEPNFL
jgi:hypothetical protein